MLCVACVVREVGVEGNEVHNFAHCKTPFLWVGKGNQVMESSHRQGLCFPRKEGISNRRCPDSCCSTEQKLLTTCGWRPEASFALTAMFSHGSKSSE